MSATRKPRSDSVLKTLPPERQEAIAEYAAQHSLAETVAWLAADGLKVSVNQVSKFGKWWSLRESFRSDEETTEELLQQLKREMPELSDEKLDEIGQRTFSLLAIRNQDPETFVMVRGSRNKAEIEKAKLALREKTEARHQKKLELEISKARDLAAEKMLDAALRKQAEEINASSMSQADKIKAMRAAAFADVDALQASGAVVIPKS